MTKPIREIQAGDRIKLRSGETITAAEDAQLIVPDPFYRVIAIKGCVDAIEGAPDDLFEVADEDEWPEELESRT